MAEPKPKSEKWKLIERMLRMLKERTWDSMDPEIKETYGFRAYSQARNYVLMHLRQFTIPELEVITECDVSELFIQALQGQDPSQYTEIRGRGRPRGSRDMQPRKRRWKKRPD